LHFLLLQYMGQDVHENMLRDTVNVPYFNGRTLAYPSIRVRMDFRDPNTIGMFPYHCHLLEHEDKGMMGSIRVIAPASRVDATANTAASERSHLSASPEVKSSQR
jgi:FtsP/CotA-like multicopper oxidase with cupredoxin domain